MTLSYETARDRLSACGQEHVLRHWEELSADGRGALLEQIASLDPAALAGMQDLLETGAASAAAPDIEPAEVIPLAGRDPATSIAEGEAALANGEVGVILVAGGQGSRLGFDGPKGAFPIGPLTDASLFAVHSRKIAAREKRSGAPIPFYIMTSAANDAATRKFFRRHDWFGLDAERVKFFVQGMWPALWPDGRMVLDRPGHVFTSPDGHGGLLSALRRQGMLEDMRQRGLKTLFYFQVDNPLVEIADPDFIGLHRLREANVSVKVCAKRGPDEGLGVVVLRDGRPAIVEYTELTDEQKHARDREGRLRFLFGSVAIHVFSLEFLNRECRAELPLHLAHKKVPYCDERGRTVKPDKPNAFKFEKFIFDVLPHADNAINVEFRREREFSPVKNAEGRDSPATARRDMMRKWADWLEACGAGVPRDEAGQPLHRLEIDPLYALDRAELADRIEPGFTVTKDLLLR